MEKIQKRVTKLVIKLNNKPYVDRLTYLNLPALKYRCLRGDIIDVFKITHNIYNTTVSSDISFNKRANTTGNNYKLHNQLFHYIYESVFLCTLLITGIVCLIQLLMLALLMHLKHI